MMKTPSSVRILSIRFTDDGNITIDWLDENEMSKNGGTIRSTYVTPSGIAESKEVEYYVIELMQDCDELLGHARKLVERT
jgi:hypothetical protein